MTSDHSPVDDSRNWRELWTTVEPKLESYVATAIIFAYTSLTAFKIITRFVFSELSTLWMQEVIIGLFVWAAWLSVASLQRTDNHIRFTAVIDKLPRWGIYGVYVIEWLLWFALSGVILRYSITFVGQYIRSGATITGTSVPQYVFYLSIPVGFSLIVLRTVQQMIRVTRRFRAGEEIRAETDLAKGGEGA